MCQPNSRRRRALLLSIAVAAALALTAPDLWAQGRPALVQVDPVRAEPMIETSEVLGRIVTRQEGPIATRIAGAVAAVTVNVGDRVAAGDVLAQLVPDRRRFERDLAQAELDAAEGERQAAASQLALREQERRRLRSLKGSAAFSPARLEDKVAEITTARSRLAASAGRLQMAQARLKVREWDLQYSVIRAPYPGVVTVRHVSPGAFLQVGAAVVTLIDDTTLEIEADVPSYRVAGLRAGTAVELRLDDGSTHSAIVRAVVPRENPLTRTRAVRFKARFGITERPLAIDQSVTLLLPIGLPRDIVSVHKDGVIRRGSQAVVFVVEDGKAVERTVVLGGAVGGRFEVVSGLAPGDQVVVRGNERLRPGQAVNITAPPADEAAKEPS